MNRCNRLTLDAHDAANNHNMTPFPPLHVRKDFLQQPHEPEEVGVHHSLHLVNGLTLDGSNQTHPSITYCERKSRLSGNITQNMHICRTNSSTCRFSASIEPNGLDLLRMSTLRSGRLSTQALMESSSHTSSCLISRVLPRARPAASTSASPLLTFLMVAYTTTNTTIDSFWFLFLAAVEKTAAVKLVAQRLFQKQCVSRSG